MSIASEITRLQNAKASIKTSIENKGVTVPSNTKLDGYSTLVDSINREPDIITEFKDLVVLSGRNSASVATSAPDGYTLLAKGLVYYSKSSSEPTIRTVNTPSDASMQFTFSSNFSSNRTYRNAVQFIWGKENN